MWNCFWVGVLSCSLFACTYYRVSDPASGRVYYTNQVKRYDQSGSIGFEDKRTGQHVTLSSSEYETITENEYKRAIKNLDLP